MVDKEQVEEKREELKQEGLLPADEPKAESHVPALIMLAAPYAVVLLAALAALYYFH